MNPFEHTTSVAIELSNLCQYSWLHTKCPLHLEMESPFVVKEPKILPAHIVYSVLDELGQHDYSKQISFHQYNEPLIDPRLFEFVRYARGKCPDSKIVILTNGHYLTPVLAEELTEAGVTEILVTPYGGTLGIKDYCYLKRLDLDDRLTMYDRPPINSKKPCFAPLTQVCVTKDAEISLCCMDWKRQYIFGDLNRCSLEQILCSEIVQNAYRRLSQGDRFLALCQRCNTARGAKNA